MATKETYNDIFLLYNEQEKGPEAVVDALRERGITVYFFRTDFPAGGEILSGEAARLEAARAVMVLLGLHGWGPTQREIAHRAESLQKPMIPVLIGEPPETAFEEVGGMFRRRRWIDLRKPTSNAHDGLARAVRQVLGAEPLDSPEQSSPRFDEIIKTLVDGSEADRSALLERIRRDGVTDRNGLAARLRSSIQEDFSPSQEGRFAAAIRDPKRLASTRSWMLSVLIWMEPLSRESVELILDYIRPEHEPDRAVRFWTLAGIIQAQLPYLGDAIGKARDDPAPEVSGLAAIASDPNNDFTLNDFRLWVSSEHFETAWRVLRILRIYPVPALAGEVVAQLERWAENKALTYDALFALASREMALAARPIILEKVGLLRFTQLIIRESRGSTPVSVTAFARVLSVFDRQQVRSALREAAADAEDRQVVRGILDDIAETLSDVSEGEPPSPGHAPEKIDISKDDIGITRDVQTLASVMLARDVDPPLAIGLFGEWGSGKSFYIKSIEAAVNDIATRATSQGQKQFCSRIVQIHFNAWHYVDTNLWASLVTHMLDGLSAHLAPQQSPAEQRAALARDLASARSEMELAKSEQMLATTQLERTTKDLQEKILERERSEVKLRDLRAADLLALLHDQGELDMILRSALKDVGAPAALESIAELNKVVEESYSTAGRVVALLVSLVNGRNILIIFFGIILFFAAPPLIILGVEGVMNKYAATISASIAKMTVAAGSVTLILRLALEKAKSSLDALSRAKRKVDEQLAAKRLTPSKEEEQLQEKVTGARASEKAAAERVAAATARAQELEGRVATLEDSQSLGYFIAERSRSEDYRRHLGLISMIRKDFDGLVDRVRGARSGEKGIDRIILYIDDVDRCPPHMVVDILQAVHLLLAYELFVVVLSVDPRWLLRSLETRMTQLQTDGSTIAEGMSATPQDYLEKIFQIPFSVRPMGKHGFGRLMRRLFAPSVGQLAATPLQPEQLEPREAGRSSPAQLPAPRTPTGGAEGGMQTPPVQPPSPVGTPSVPEKAPSTDLNALADVLVISPVEAEFSQKLHFLLPTPRSAKRFVNIYRLLKASLPRGELARFEGTQGVPGDFQLPMLLIALLVGQSTIAGGLFPQLLTRAREGRQDWWQTAWATRALSAQEAWLREQLDEVVGAFYFPHSPDLVVLWLPQVARYSFNTAKVFLEAR